MDQKSQLSHPFRSRVPGYAILGNVCQAWWQQPLLPLQVVRQVLRARLQSPPSHDHQAFQTDHPHLSVLQQTVSESVRTSKSHLPESLSQKHALWCLRFFLIWSDNRSYWSYNFEKCLIFLATFQDYFVNPCVSSIYLILVKRVLWKVNIIKDILSFVNSCSILNLPFSC